MHRDLGGEFTAQSVDEVSVCSNQICLPNVFTEVVRSWLVLWSLSVFKIWARRILVKYLSIHCSICEVLAAHGQNRSRPNSWNRYWISCSLWLEISCKLVTRHIVVRVKGLCRVHLNPSITRWKSFCSQLCVIYTFLAQGPQPIFHRLRCMKLIKLMCDWLKGCGHV